MRVRVKICGLTSPETARAAVDAGADAIGVVLAPSLRRVSADEAAALFETLPPFVSRVAVFQRPDRDDARMALARLDPDVVQCEAEDRALFELRRGCVFLPVLHDGSDLEDRVAACSSATMLIEGTRSGTGSAADWGRVLRAIDARAGRLAPAEAGARAHARSPSAPLPAPRSTAEPVRLVLSGGLDPENVGDAIRMLRPWAVDVSSGVEARPGVKDPARIVRFLAAVRAAERDL